MIEAGHAYCIATSLHKESRWPDTMGHIHFCCRLLLVLVIVVLSFIHFVYLYQIQTAFNKFMLEVAHENWKQFKTKGFINEYLIEITAALNGSPERLITMCSGSRFQNIFIWIQLTNHAVGVIHYYALSLWQQVSTSFSESK